ncbi:MAG: hypothetical protein AB1467_02850 [Candidatus Diapherotrites archaeon]
MPKGKRTKTPNWMVKGRQKDLRNKPKPKWDFRKKPERPLDSGEIHMFAMYHGKQLRKSGIRKITETENKFVIEYVDNAVQFLPKPHLKK